MLHVALCAFGQPRGCRGNHLQRRGEYLGRCGEYLGQRGELLWQRGEYLGRRGGLLWQRGEYLGQRGELLWRRGEYLGHRGGLLWRRGGYLGRPAVGSRHYGDRRQSPRLVAPSGGVAERGLLGYGCDDGGLSLHALGQCGHRAVLGADIGAHLYGVLMCLGDGHALEDAGAEGAGKRVAGAHGVGNIHLGSRLERLAAGGEDIAAVDTTGEHEHVQIVLAEDEPALVLNVQTGIAEEAAQRDELFIVYLQYIATLQTLADNLLGIEILAEIDVKDLESVAGRVVEKLVDGITARSAALGQ